MASAAEIALALLVQAELVVVPGIREIPDEPTMIGFADENADEINNAVFVFTVQGRQFGRDQRGGKVVQHPGLKFNIRHLDKRVGSDFAEAVYRFYEGYAISVVNPGTVEARGYVYYVQSVYPTSSVISLGEEEGKHRYLWSFNANLAFQTVPPTPVEE